MKRLLQSFEEYAAGLLLAAVTLLIITQLAVNYPSPQLVLALFFWASMLGIPAATRRGAHLSLIYLGRRVSARWRRMLMNVLLAASVVFFAALAVTGVQLCLQQVRHHNTFVGARWPAWLVAASIPSAAVISCIRAVQAWRDARATGEGKE